MPAKNFEIRISDGSSFGSEGNADSHLYFPKTSVSQVVGLLDSNSKINLSLMPSFIFGSQKWLGTINANLQASSLLEDLCAEAQNVGITNLLLLKGMYFQAQGNTEIDFSQNINVTEGDYPLFYEFFGNCILTFAHSGDEDDVGGNTLAVENNDYVVFSGYSGASGEIMVTFSVVNNTYQNATSQQRGIVQLASEAEIIEGTNTAKAVTPAGAKKAVQQFGYTHPAIGINLNVGQFTSLKTITGMTFSEDGNHIKSITTSDIATATTSNKGVVQLITSEQGKVENLTGFGSGYAVSPDVAQTMIDYWGKINYFSSLANANASPVKNVIGKVVFVEV